MRRPAKTLIVAQGTVAVLALIGLTLWPPASGRLLVIPLGRGDPNAVARVALAGGAALLGEGPFPGSLVVVGDRARLARRIGSWDMLVMAAPPAGCGAADPAAAAGETRS